MLWANSPGLQDRTRIRGWTDELVATPAVLLGLNALHQEVASLKEQCRTQDFRPISNDAFWMSLNLWLSNNHHLSRHKESIYCVNQTENLVEEATL